jgi:hypothetical protein
MLDYIISHDYPVYSYVLQTPGSDENNVDGVYVYMCVLFKNPQQNPYLVVFHGP